MTCGMIKLKGCSIDKTGKIREPNVISYAIMNLYNIVYVFIFLVKFCF